MRGTFMSLAVAASLVAGVTGEVNAKPTASTGATAAIVVPPAIAGLLTAYPNGGESMTQAIVDALMQDPSVAPAIVEIGNKGNPEQMAAVALGLQRAIKLLSATNPAGARTVRAALLGANPTFSAVYAALASQTYAQGGGGTAPLPGFGGGFGTVGGGGGGAIVNPPINPPLATPN